MMFKSKVTIQLFFCQIYKKHPRTQSMKLKVKESKNPFSSHTIIEFLAHIHAHSKHLPFACH